MQKETLTLTNIAKDLKFIASTHEDIAIDRYGGPGLAVLAAALIVGAFTKRPWIALLLAACAVYPIIRYVKEYKKYREMKKAIETVIMRGDVSISVSELSHISQETVYEPHSTGRGRVHNTKEVTFFYFLAGKRWRVPNTGKLYEWSKEYYISPQGLENISLAGDSFFYVSLQGYPDIAYIYPCKSFVLDSSLKIAD